MYSAAKIVLADFDRNATMQLLKLDGTDLRKVYGNKLPSFHLVFEENKHL